MKTVNVKFFGAFRKFVPTGESQIEIASDMSASDFKGLIQTHLEKMCSNFSEVTLIAESALATDQRVLNCHDVIDGSSMIAILPPVCGG